MGKCEEAVASFEQALERAVSDDMLADANALEDELLSAEEHLQWSKTKIYYGVLGLLKNCSAADIRKAYLREGLKHHPDKGGDAEKFKLVLNAYEVLSDPLQRKRYDREPHDMKVNEENSNGYGNSDEDASGDKDDRGDEDSTDEDSGDDGDELTDGDLADLFRQWKDTHPRLFAGMRFGSSNHRK